MQPMAVMVALGSIGMLLACSSGPEVSVKEPDLVEVVGPAQAAGNKIAVDIYVDATESMRGYVADPRSVYVKFLQAVDGAVIAGWKDANRTFYRFGSTAQPMTRAAFIEAGVSNFYTEKKTNIDIVVGQANPEKVSVIVTDLFQTDANLNAIVDRIKDKCFHRDISVGILGVPSQFEGMVYDAPGGAYRYASGSGAETKRPFYAIMFGSPGNLGRLVDSLEGMEGVDKDRFILITPYVVRGVSASIEKGKNVKSLNVLVAGKRFRLVGSESNAGKFDVNLSLVRTPYAAQFVTDKLELEAYRAKRTQRQRDLLQGERTDDFAVTALKATPNGVSLGLDYSLHPVGAREGIYDYVLYLRTAAQGGFENPAWVRNFSSEDPTAARDANKTLNLERFVQMLMTTASTVHRPYVAKFWFTVEAH